MTTNPTPAATPVVDVASGEWISRYDAVHSNGALAAAPIEYLDVMPWVNGPDGARYITHADLSEWLAGDFYGRAGAAIQAREDADWRGREDNQ